MNDTNNQSIDFTEVLLTISRGRYKIIFITSIFVGLSIAYAMLAKPMFDCTTKVIYESSQNSSLSGDIGALAAMAGVGSIEGVSISDYLQDIIYSNKFILPMLNISWQIREEDTAKSYLLDYWEFEKDSLVVNSDRVLHYEGAEELKNRIEYSVDMKTGIIKIRTIAETPFLAYQLNNYVVKELNEVVLTKLNVKTRQNKQFIKNRLDESKLELDSIELLYKEFKKINFITSDPEIILQDQRIQREMNVSQKIYLTLRQQYEMAKIEEQRDIPVISVIEEAHIPYKKFLPKRKFIVVLGSMAGLFFAVIFVFVLAFIKKNIQLVKYIINPEKYSIK